MGREDRAPTAAWGQQLKETPWAPSLQDLHIGKGVTAARSAPEPPPRGSGASLQQDLPAVAQHQTKQLKQEYILGSKHSLFL